MSTAYFEAGLFFEKSRSARPREVGRRPRGMVAWCHGGGTVARWHGGTGAAGGRRGTAAEKSGRNVSYTFGRIIGKCLLL